MSVIHGVNYGTPTLDLNFARNKSLIDTTSGRNLVTFTRASTGTYVGADGLIKSAVADEPRFDHNPATGESLGLLVEESRTNLITSSEILNPTYGGVFGISELNAAIAPNNTFTATQITQGSSGGWISPGAGTFTYSIFVKQRTSPTLSLIYAGYGGTDWTFTFATESLSVVGVWSNASVQKFPNGWYKLSATTGSRNLYYFYFSTSSSTTNALIWGLQVEAGTFPTSYIPTAGSTVTRSADQASITGTNFSSWYNQNTGTLFAAQRSDTIQDAYQTSTFVLSSSNANAHYIGMEVTNDYNRCYVYGNGLTGRPEPYGSVTPGTLTKNVLAYANNNVAAARNGGTVLTDTTVGLPIVEIDRATIGHSNNGGYQKRQHLSRLTYYPTRLQDFQLRQLTK